MFDDTAPWSEGAPRSAADAEAQATWADFEVALFECVLGMNLSDVADRLILDVPSAGSTEQGPRVIFHSTGDGSVRAAILAEAESLPSLALEPATAQYFNSSGWQQGQRNGLHVWRSVDLTQSGGAKDLASVVHAVAVALRTVLGVSHPHLMSSRANGRVINRAHLLGLPSTFAVRNEAETAAAEQRLSDLAEARRSRRHLRRPAPDSEADAAPDLDAGHGDAHGDAHGEESEDGRDDEDDTRPYGGRVDTAAFAFDSVDETRAFVTSLLRHSPEVDFFADDDGTVGFHHGDQPVFVEVRTDQPAVVMSTRVVHDVPSSEAALAEINRLNDQNFWMRWTLQDDAIWLSAVVPAAPLSPVHLLGLLFVLGQSLDDSGNALATKLGAKPF